MASPLPDPTTLVSDYLMGIPLTDGMGNTISQATIQNYIDRAVQWMKTQLQVDLVPNVITQEPHDYNIEEYYQYCYIRLYHYPVISVQNVTANWGGVQVMTFPTEWYNYMPESGQLQMVPTEGTLSEVMLGQGAASLLPMITSGLTYMPFLFKVDYTAGFPPGDGTIPDDIANLIAAKAAIAVMNLASGLILGGSGITSTSLGIDGLSQSISTARSGQGDLYAGRMNFYQNQINSELPALKRYYKGLRFISV